jgi:hypothetical protein
MKIDLSAIDVTAVINYAGVGMVSISAISEDGTMMTGLLLPDSARALGKVCFKEAEVADVETLIYELLRNILDLDEDVLSDFMTEFKKAREA